MREALNEVPAQGQVHFLHGIDHALLQAAYSLARAFLFPSLAEGFGWPIVEAQACGCPVITTDDAPMNEIGGPHTDYLPLLRSTDDMALWAARGARVLEKLLNEPAQAQSERTDACMTWSRRFESARAIAAYLQIYEGVMARHPTNADHALARTPS
ncbi:D-inositol-3-phosphate glycosyltransferase [compost metagenome]